MPVVRRSAPVCYKTNSEDLAQNVADGKENVL